MAQTAAVRLAIARAGELISEFQPVPASVDIVRLAYELGVGAVEPTETTADGYLGRRRDGTLVIRYRSQNTVYRNRFTVAHEIAHLLLAQAEGKDFASATVHHGEGFHEEAAVNRIAAELLMPASFILDELESRELRGMRPSWRTVNDLSRLYHVSSTAMAFRILELCDVIAISIRVNIEGCGPRFPFDRSEGSAIHLVNGVEFEMERLWREARKCTRHIVPIRINRETTEIPCEGMAKSFSTRLGSARHYWVIGWKIPESRLPDIESSYGNEC